MSESKYKVLWDTLKQKPGTPIKLAALAAGHKRLKKAIVKRKYKDNGFKYLMQEQNKVAELKFISEGNILIVQLNIGVNSSWL